MLKNFKTFFKLKVTAVAVHSAGQATGERNSGAFGNSRILTRVANSMTKLDTAVTVADYCR